jgi:cell division control protein 6
VNRVSIVLLDEVDHLVTREQDVLYRLFEWASVPESRLILIGIANALDLTDRLLPRLRAVNSKLVLGSASYDLDAYRIGRFS